MGILADSLFALDDSDTAVDAALRLALLTETGVALGLTGQHIKVIAGAAAVQRALGSPLRAPQVPPRIESLTSEQGFFFLFFFFF